MQEKSHFRVHVGGFRTGYYGKIIKAGTGILKRAGPYILRKWVTFFTVDYLAWDKMVKTVKSSTQGKINNKDQNGK